MTERERRVDNCVGASSPRSAKPSSTSTASPNARSVDRSRPSWRDAPEESRSPAAEAPRSSDAYVAPRAGLVLHGPLADRPLRRPPRATAEYARPHGHPGRSHVARRDHDRAVRHDRALRREDGCRRRERDRRLRRRPADRDRHRARPDARGRRPGALERSPRPRVDDRRSQGRLRVDRSGRGRSDHARRRLPPPPVVENERAVGIVSIRDLAEWSIRPEKSPT